MPKHAQSARSADRPAKKAKIEKPSKILSRVKGSPRPAFKAAPSKAEKPPPATPIPISRKGKEKAPAPLPESKSTIKKKPTKAEEIPDVLPSTFKVIAGSYEKLLYGLDGTVTVDSDSKLEFHLKPVFIFPAHVSCIKSVAASPHGGKWLATGSADEIVKVWDLRRRKEIGGLMHHEGSITHLSFPSRSHLLSASEDGTLCLFRARDWAVLRALKGHKGRVNSVAVHPSGKVALSVGQDRTLRMWDLMRGKGSASTKLGKEGELVRWSTDGSMFVVQTGSTIDLYTTDMALLHTIIHPSRLHDVRFCKRVVGEGDVLLAGAEDKKLSIYEVSTSPNQIPKIIAAMVGHTNRVKSAQILDIALPPSSSGRTSTTIVCTASSDGRIHLYDMAALPAVSGASEVVEIGSVAEYDSKGTRLTCVTLADGETDNTSLNGKRKRVDEKEEDDSDEDDSDEEDEDNAEGEGGEGGEEEEAEEEEAEEEDEADEE